MSIIYAADLHLDNRNPDVRGETGRYVRETEAEAMLEALLSVCAKQHASTLIIAGDLSNNRNPRAWVYTAFATFLDSAHRQGLKVVAMPGNHDRDETGEPEFGDAFAKHPAFTYVKAPEVIAADGKLILMLPWVGRTRVAAKSGATMMVSEQHAYIQTALERIVQTHAADVVVTHYTIAGARYSSEAQPLLGDSAELMLPAMMFNQPGIKYVVSGHVHKAQTLTSGAVPVFYPGSTILCDFGQEKEQPQVVLDDGSRDVRHIPLYYKHLRFATVEEGTEIANLTGAIVRFKGSIPSGDEGVRWLATFTDKLAALSPLYIAKPKVSLTRHDVRVEHTITAEVSPEAAFAEYTALAGGEYQERSDALMPLHHDIERTVNDAAIDV